MTVALVLPDTTVGMTAASITRRPRVPLTPQFGVDDRHRPRSHHAGTGLMERGAGGGTHVFEQVVVALRLRPGHVLVGNPPAHGLGGEDFANHPEAGDDRVLVALRRQVIGLHRRRARGVGAGDAQPAAAFRTARDRHHRAGREPVHRIAGLLSAAGEELILHIRTVQLGTGLHEQPDRTGAGHQRSLTRQDPFGSGIKPPQPVVINFVHRHGAVDATIHHAATDMILQVLANAGQIVHHRNADGSQQSAGTDAGQLQQLRRVGIKHHDWARKEKLRSFAGYPLTYKGRVIAVLALFSEKAFSPVDFEILGIFSDQISKELSGFFETREFLDKLEIQD